MCGIVGLFLKNPALQSTLGAHVETMLIGMSERGPDSAGIAVYHSPVAKGRSKLTLFNADEAYPWRKLAGEMPALRTSLLKPGDKIRTTTVSLARPCHRHRSGSLFGRGPGHRPR